MQLRPDKGLMAEINVTPLVDVMLVLLIIFMMSASIETSQVKKKVKEEEKKQKIDTSKFNEDDFLAMIEEMYYLTNSGMPIHKSVSTFI